MKFEICVDSAAGVRAARDAGAHRVELCAALFEGGITPSHGSIVQARRVTGIALNIIIRPRGGDFHFDDDEFAIMLADIAVAKAEGVDGVVIGILTAEGRVDAQRSRTLIEAASPLPVTFHRAFDMTADPFEALETLIAIGASRVLTSGQAATVLEGLPLIAALMQQAAGRIIVMPGGGITARNIGRIVNELAPEELHFAALAEGPSPMLFQRGHVFMGGELRAPEYRRLETSPVGVATLMQAATDATG